MIRALIVEDEPHARSLLERLARELRWLELLGSAADGRDAIEQIDRLRPDLLFLDVQLPECSGLEVLERARHDPAVIFTTAFDRHAVTAFELGALDYLLKPFGGDRFRLAAERARLALGHGEGALERARHALSEAPLTRLWTHVGNKLVVIDVDDVISIEGADDYAALTTTSGSFLVAVRLADLERRLGDPFLRVHRSHIVNLARSAALRARPDGRLEVELEDGRSVVASRAGSSRLRRCLRRDAPRVER